MMNEPEYISELGVVGAPLRYKWSNDLALEFYAAKDQNLKLYDAVDLSTYRAVMALGIVVTECIVWRFKGLTNLTDSMNRVEAAWASSLDPTYARSLKIEFTKDNDREFVEGPLELAMRVLNILDTRFRKGLIYLPGTVVKQAILAQHLFPDKKKFSNWLSDLLKRTAEAFPRTVKYDRKTEIYDASLEKPVPPQFFSTRFTYSEAAARDAWNQFLQSLKPAENPYLRTPDEMIAAGFEGTPYVL
jgi:hypothetical protein